MTTQWVATKGHLILLAERGMANYAIAQQLGISRPAVLAVRSAFLKRGVAAITGLAKRKCRAKVLTPELEQKILDTTLKTRPADGSTHWSVRTMAKQLGVSRTIVSDGQPIERAAKFADQRSCIIRPDLAA